MRAVVLDNEAVAALREPSHGKHRMVMAHLQAVVDRRTRGDLVTVVVPCAVRAEAGWDRSAPSAAVINRYRVTDVPLDSERTNLAAALVATEQVSVADAHIGATVLAAGWTDTVVLTSDPDDMRRVCSPSPIRAIRI